MQKNNLFSLALPLYLALSFVFLPAYSFAKVIWQEYEGLVSPEAIVDVAATIDGSRIYLLTDSGKVLVYDHEKRLLGSKEVGKSVEKIFALGLQGAGIPEGLLLVEGKKIREMSLKFAVEIDIKGAPFVGNPEAEVVIVEFSDFLCPFCSQTKALTDRLIANNPDKLKVVFKPFAGPQGRPAAIAALAAHQQGKFWEMHKELFANQRELDPARIRNIAQEIGLDMTQFDRDIASRALAQQFEKNIIDGQRAGVRGTPALFVNGIAVTERSLEGIQQLIDSSLQN